MLEVGSVSGSEAEAMLNGGCGNECVWKADAGLPTNTAGPFGHGAIHRHLPKRGKQHADQIGGGIASEELGPGDD
jgi:hypothetical protein